MLDDTEVNEFPAVVTEHDHDVEDPERDGYDDKHVDGGNAVHLIPRERAPARRWRTGAPNHVLGDSRLADADPEFEELAMDPGGVPERIGLAHLADRVANPMIYRRSSEPARS